MFLRAFPNLSQVLYRESHWVDVTLYSLMFFFTHSSYNWLDHYVCHVITPTRRSSVINACKTSVSFVPSGSVMLAGERQAIASLGIEPTGKASGNEPRDFARIS